MNDLKFAFRQLLKNPGFTAVAVLTLALAIGANTAIFSFVNAILLRPLLYKDADRLVTVYENQYRHAHNYVVLGKLKPGVSVAQADAEMSPAAPEYRCGCSVLAARSARDQGRSGGGAAL